jgi:hypothetical protein
LSDGEGVIVSIARRWSEWWFVSAAPAELALCRIAWSAVCLAYLWNPALDARIAAFDPTAPAYAPLPILSLLAAPFGGPSQLSAATLHIVLLASRVAGVLALLGLFTRAAVPLLALGGMLVHAWASSFGEFVHDSSLVHWALLVLAFAPCGAAFSIDASIARARGLRERASAFQPIPEVGWVLRLVHVLIALAYLSASATKLARGREEWFSGYTLHYYLSFHALRSQSEWGLWLMRHHVLVVAGSWLVGLFESTFVLSLVFRRWAWLWTVGSVFVHASAFLFMGVLFPSFPALCLVMLPWRRIFERFQRAESAPRVGVARVTPS